MAGSGVELQLGAVSLVDASAVAVLLTVRRAAMTRDIEMTLIAVQPIVRRSLAIGRPGIIASDSPSCDGSR